MHNLVVMYIESQPLFKVRYIKSHYPILFVSALICKQVRLLHPRWVVDLLHTAVKFLPDMQVDGMLKLREQINSNVKDSGVKISVNDFVIKAAALALKKVGSRENPYDLFILL